MRSGALAGRAFAAIARPCSDSIGAGQGLRVAAWLAIALGIAVRIALLGDKPFWRDESWVAMMIESPLSRTLELRKPVPIGFVALIQQLARIAPPLAVEWLYRLVPLAAGIATLPVLAALGRRLGANLWVTTAALWLAAGMPALVFYSRELKPYALDVLFAACVPWLVLRAVQDQRPVGPALVAALMAAPWLTFGSLFPIAAVLSWAWLCHWGPGPWRLRAPALVASAGYAVSFACVWALAIRSQASNPGLLDHWSRKLLGGSGWLELADVFERFVGKSFPYQFCEIWPAAAVLGVFGLAAWPRGSRGVLAWWFGATAAITVVAALADRYVLVERLLLFTAPVYLLATAGGGVALASAAAGRRGPALAVAAAALVGVGWSAQALVHRVDVPPNDPERYFLFDVLHDVDPIIDQLERRVGQAEPVLFSPYSEQPFRYVRRGRLAQAETCHHFVCPEHDALVADWAPKVRSRGWLVLIEGEEETLFAQPLAEAGLRWHQAAAARGVRLWKVERS